MNNYVCLFNWKLKTLKVLIIRESMQITLYVKSHHLKIAIATFVKKVALHSLTKLRLIENKGMKLGMYLWQKKWGDRKIIQENKLTMKSLHIKSSKFFKWSRQNQIQNDAIQKKNTKIKAKKISSCDNEVKSQKPSVV